MPNHNAPNLEKYRLAARHLQTIEILIRGSMEQDNGCREWQKAIQSNGYGVIHHRGKAMLAHRLSYWTFNGPIEGELVVDHMCHNRKCVEPGHLRLLTNADNMAQSLPAKKTHCKRGHPLSGDNIYVYFYNGSRHRQCKACGHEKQIRHTAARRAAREGLRQAALSAAG